MVALPGPAAGSPPGLRDPRAGSIPPRAEVSVPSSPGHGGAVLGPWGEAQGRCGRLRGSRLAHGLCACPGARACSRPLNTSGHTAPPARDTARATRCRRISQHHCCPRRRDVAGQAVAHGRSRIGQEVPAARSWPRGWAGTAGPCVEPVVLAGPDAVPRASRDPSASSEARSRAVSDTYTHPHAHTHPLPHGSFGVLERINC